MSLLRRGLRRALPLRLRQAIAQLRRRCSDRFRGVRLETDRAPEDLSGYALQVELRQPVTGGALRANKLSNLSVGAARVNRTRLAPGAIWSFWYYVGPPSARNGFLAGRNLLEGRLVAQTGGGLCQLSGLLHHLALMTGLVIEERHAHSLDIYHEHERFTPLGADATVVWGTKDLRLMNPHATAVLIECSVEEDVLSARLYARQPLPEQLVTFLREPAGPQRVRVDTFINARLHASTEYEQRQGLSLMAP